MSSRMVHDAWQTMSLECLLDYTEEAEMLYSETRGEYSLVNEGMFEATGFTMLMQAFSPLFAEYCKLSASQPGARQ